MAFCWVETVDVCGGGERNTLLTMVEGVEEFGAKMLQTINGSLQALAPEQWHRNLLMCITFGNGDLFYCVVIESE